MTDILENLITQVSKLSSFERTVLYRRLKGIYPEKKDHAGKRYLMSKGRYGNRKQSTWNGNMHLCCNSKNAYYHRAKCAFCLSNYDDDLSDLKDI